MEDRREEIRLPQEETLEMMAKLMARCRARHPFFHFEMVSPKSGHIVISGMDQFDNQSEFTYSNNDKEFDSWLDSITPPKPKPNSF